MVADPTARVSYHQTFTSRIEAAGGRVVPIRYDAPYDEIIYLLKAVNGVLLTGGEVNLKAKESPYLQSGRDR